jgi:hypothetical protein
MDLKDRLLKLAHEVLPDKTYHFKSNVNLSGKGLKSLRELPIKIKIVDGNFDISGNELVDLKGCPEKVTSLTADNNALKSLEGSPKSISDTMRVNKNPLTNLKGAPQFIGGNFEAKECGLISLVGGPAEVKGVYDVSHNKLKSGYGIAAKVGKSINLDYNLFEKLDIEDVELRKITSIKKNPLKDYTGFTPEHFVKAGRVTYEDSPKGLILKTSYSFSEDYLLDSLELLPFKIYMAEKDFHFVRRKGLGLKVKNLKGSPEIVKTTFDASSNELESLEGGPRIVEGKYMVSFNKLKDLKGFPEYVGSSVMFNMNYNLASIEGIGQIVGPLFMLGCPFRDLSPLKDNKTPLKIVTDEPDLSKFYNVPPFVTFQQAETI